MWPSSSHGARARSPSFCHHRHTRPTPPCGGGGRGKLLGTWCGRWRLRQQAAGIHRDIGGGGAAARGAVGGRRTFVSRRMVAVRFQQPKHASWPTGKNVIRDAMLLHERTRKDDIFRVNGTLQCSLQCSLHLHALRSPTCGPYRIACCCSPTLAPAATQTAASRTHNQLPHVTPSPSALLNTTPALAFTPSTTR